MPSPIAHLSAGLAIYVATRAHLPRTEPEKVGPVPFLLVVTTAFSLLPDVDSLVGLAAGDFGRFHNNLTHSLLVGLAVAPAFGGLMQHRRGSGFWFWSIIALVAYNLHVLMDWATVGRGVMALWPLTDARFQAPVMLFYGLHWSDGWLSIRHVWTVVTELLFAVVVFILLLPSLAAGRRKAQA
jgi:membrane-bound metal-dependent hydrolase YbcI (DUF457 family)